MANVPAGKLPDATIQEAHLSGPILFHLASQARPGLLILLTV